MHSLETMEMKYNKLIRWYGIPICITSIAPDHPVLPTYTPFVRRGFFGSGCRNPPASSLSPPGLSGLSRFSDLSSLLITYHLKFNLTKVLIA